MTEPHTSGIQLTGRMPWGAALAGPLADAAALWQDLDGLHVTAPPPHPPHTSCLWAWTPGGTCVRVRLDGDPAYVARHTPLPGEATTTIPWSSEDRRVLAFRPADDNAAVDTAYEQIVTSPDGHGQPVTFIRPAGRF